MAAMLKHAVFSAFVVFLACSNSNPDSDGGTDSGTDAQTFSYQPQGCSYTVTLPDSRGFTYIALDDGAAVTDVAGATPTRVRLGLGGATQGADPKTTAVFTWESSAATSKTAEVKINGTIYKGHVWQTPPPTIGIGTTDPPANMHEVHLCGLTAGTTYAYHVGGGASGADVWSTAQPFPTPPAAG